jgi:hypothetical protein
MGQVVVTMFIWTPYMLDALPHDHPSSSAVFGPSCCACALELSCYSMMKEEPIISSVTCLPELLLFLKSAVHYAVCSLMST